MEKLLGWQSNPFRYRKVLALVVESGAIYSSALAIEITLYFLNTNAFYIIYDPIAQLTVRPLSPCQYHINSHLFTGYRANHDHCAH